MSKQKDLLTDWQIHKHTDKAVILFSKVLTVIIIIIIIIII